MKLMIPLRYTAPGLIAASLLVAAPVQADISRGAVMASTCYACHGTDGKSPGAIPSIHGVPAASMIVNMKAFRDGTRLATVMDRHARGYTDEEIELIANYLSQVR